MKGGGYSSVGYSRELSGSKKEMKENDCESINFTTKLQKIQPAISKSSQGDILKVELDKDEKIVAVSSDGICGYISSIESIELIDCINKGNIYKATIINLSTSSCEVRVRILK